jgi:hypothetical protein
MGKTGSVNWMQVKGVKGQIRLVPQKDAEVKKPGPNQRFKPNAGTRFSKSPEEEARSRQGNRRGGRGRGGREKDPRLRRRIRRSKSAIMGAKSKAKK